MRLADQFDRLRASLQEDCGEALDRELAQLVIALEDKRFWKHHGVDLIALTRAFVQMLLGRSKGGASTIDMQFVRTVTQERDLTFRRKLREILLAVAVRREFGARLILTRYLAIAYTGTGLNGMEDASLTLFGHPVRECNIGQKAILAATLLAPIPKLRTREWQQRINGRAKYALYRSSILTSINP